MSAALQLQPGMSRYDQAEIVSTIKQTVCKGASDAQLRMFLEVCRSTGLDPFLKEIYFVAEKSIIMASRDGYLRVANEHPQFDGMETKVERDERNVPIKATCSVWRKDRAHAITCEAYYSEYRKSGPVWQQYPSAMISKVAEVLALKRSFAINGVLTEEEMGQPEACGSQAAADAVAQRKIAEMRKSPQPAVEIVEQLPEPQDEPSAEEDYSQEEPTQLEQELHESIRMCEQLRPPKGNQPSRDEMLQAFDGLRERYQRVGFPRTLANILGRYGKRCPEDFEVSELQEARAAYKECSLDLSAREAKCRR